MDTIKLEVEGYAIVERVARNGGHSARVFMPKAWAGKKVYVILAEPLDESRSPP